MKAVLNEGQEDEFTVHGFKRSLPRTIIAHLLSLLLVGVPYLVGYWKPGWRVKWTRVRCTLHQADTVLVSDAAHDQTVEPVVIVPAPQDAPGDYVHRDGGSGSEGGAGGGRPNSVYATDTSRLWLPVSLTVRHFSHKHVKYFWSTKHGSYVRLRGLESGVPVARFTSELTSGLTSGQQKVKRVFYGRNSIEVEVKSWFKLLFEEVLNPFYIFQIGSIALWSADNYYNYASCILFISLVSIVVSLIETRRQSQNLHDMVSSSNELKVNLVRPPNSGTGGSVCDGEDVVIDEEEEVDSTEIVPGDVIVIPPHGCVMACDAALISGTCIVNESMLTGESVPVTKSALPHLDAPTDGSHPETYEPEVHKRHTLFAGTSVIQTRYYGTSKVMAVVVSTGFNTAKGDLIRSILYPKPMGFKFYRDSIRFILVLFGTAALGMLYCMYVYVVRQADVSMIILRCLDIITIVVPPALPAAMTVGTYYAQNRLKKKSIFSISPQRINICGKLKLVCFDKTGTLTEDGLDMWGVVPTLNATSHSNYDDDDAIDGRGSDEKQLRSSFVDSERSVEALPVKSPLLTCLASCHSLTLIDDALIGDPLDIKMFESTGWELEEGAAGQSDTSKFDMLMPSVVRPKKNDVDVIDTDCGSGSDSKYPHEVGIIRQLTFSSAVARMSVITRVLGGDRFVVFTKGAPEKMEDLCRPESLPDNFHALLRSFTVQGFRVIALAYRTLPRQVTWLKAQKMKREKIEADLTFLGFLVMQNTLKPETRPVIEELHKAGGIKTVMVTGDNLMTALSVAKECNMINGNKDRVFVVEAKPPKPGSNNASIKFVLSDDDDDGGDAAAANQGRGGGTDGAATNSSAVVEIERALETGSDYHFAIGGKSWATINAHFKHLVPKIIRKGTVFARMSPDQKAQLVEEYQAMDYVVSMCGDGANDCGALKAAHVGISLSEAEASVAAPFTSKIPNITCVPVIIKEGRCALVTSFGVFKYMALYSMVQFISVLLLYSLETNLGDNQFLYIDLAITTTVAVLMGWTKAYPKLVPKRPPGSLISGPNLFSIFSQILLSLGVQVGAYFYLTTMQWYVPVHPDNPDEEIVVSFETTTVFILSSFQYLMIATVFSSGPPYRKAFYTNLPFAAALVVLTACTAGLAVYPPKAVATFFSIKTGIPLHFRLTLLAFAAANGLLCFLLEHVVAKSALIKRISHILARKKEPKNKFKIVLRDMEEKEGWPDCLIDSCTDPDAADAEVNNRRHHFSPGVS